MKLALLLPGPLSTLSGGYAYDRRLVEGMRALGHGVRVVELAGQYPLPDAVAEQAAAAALRDLAPDELPVVDGLALPAFAALGAELQARRAIGLIHHPTAREVGISAKVRAELLQRETYLFPLMARLIATSALTACRLTDEFDIPPTQIGVVEPGTDAVPRAVGSGEGGGCAILSVAVLVPRKGHDVLLSALAKLGDLDWSLTIVGPPRDAAYVAQLHELAAQPALAGRVRFAGEVSPEELEHLYHQADLMALASHWEGYGMAVAEALAHGLPVAITAGGALADLAPGDARVIAQPGDVVALSRGMRRVIFDRPLRQQMADAAWRAGCALPRWNDRAEHFIAEIAKA